MNETLKKKLASVKNTINAHKPELIALGVSAVALVTYAAYVANTGKSIIPTAEVDVDIYTDESGDAMVIMATGLAKKMKDELFALKFKTETGDAMILDIRPEMN